MIRSAAAGFAAALVTGAAAAEPLFTETSEQATFSVSVVAEGMAFPWDFEFLPGGDVLISEYDGTLRVLRDGALDPAPIPAIADVTEEGGLRGLAAHPGFEENGLLYFCYASGTEDDNHTEIARGRFDGAAVSDLEVIYRAQNSAHQLAHHGCKLIFDDDDKLIATLGDRRHFADASQEVSNAYGVVVRLNDDGSPSPGNPFANQSGALPEVWAYGVRNAQGAAFHPDTNELWFSEHGPLGGDEINILRRGANYGWPVATFGIDYSGEELTDTPLRDGVEPPLYYWYPSVAPSSVAFYTGDEFPKWRGDLFVTTLGARRLLRLELNGDRVLRVEELFSGLDARLRNIEQGPDGALYVLTDSGDGRLLKIEPVQE